MQRGLTMYKYGRISSNNTSNTIISSASVGSFIQLPNIGQRKNDSTVIRNPCPADYWRWITICWAVESHTGACIQYLVVRNVCYDWRVYVKKDNNRILESFGFWEEYDYEYEILTIPSRACAWTSDILAGKHDCRRHPTTSFNENVVVYNGSKL